MVSQATFAGYFQQQSRVFFPSSSHLHSAYSPRFPVWQQHEVQASNVFIGETLKVDWEALVFYWVGRAHLQVWAAWGGSKPGRADKERTEWDEKRRKMSHTDGRRKEEVGGQWDTGDWRLTVVFPTIMQPRWKCLCHTLALGLHLLSAAPRDKMYL